MDKASKQQALAESTTAGAVVTKSTTDVLETAVRLGVKIIAASKMCGFLNAHVFEPAGRKQEQSPSVMKSVKAIPITGMCIKLEAADQSTRPVYKTFETWPDLVLEPGTGCPFKLTSVSAEVSERMAQQQRKRQQQQLSAKESNSHRHRAVQGSTNLTTQLTPVVTPQAANHSHIIAGAGRRSAVASWSRITPQTVGGRTTNTGRTLVRTQQGLKRKLMFCELCGVEYENLWDHLKTRTHERFLNEPDNFKELISVISSLPTLTDLEAANTPVTSSGTEEAENVAPSNKWSTSQVSGEEEAKREATEMSETSAYDVSNLKNRMSAATIACPADCVPETPHVDDMEL